MTQDIQEILAKQSMKGLEPEATARTVKEKWKLIQSINYLKYPYYVKLCYLQH